MSGVASKFGVELSEIWVLDGSDDGQRREEEAKGSDLETLMT